MNKRLRKQLKSVFPTAREKASKLAQNRHLETKKRAFDSFFQAQKS